MKLIEIKSLDDERVRMFGRLTDAQLRNRLNLDSAMVIVESPKVIEVALRQGWLPEALLCEARHIEGDAASVIAMMPDDTPVYTAGRELLASLTGYTLTRGVLCAMRRRECAPLEELINGARRVCVIDGVSDTTNIGAIFRSAAALGIDAVLLTPTSCDPLNRRAIRVSMGSVFLVPWGWTDTPSRLKDYGFKTVAMALRDDSRLLSDPELLSEPRLAIVMGTEGDGLAQAEIDGADYVVRIPMRHNVDSLNVAAASAVAFYALCRYFEVRSGWLTVNCMPQRQVQPLPQGCRHKVLKCGQKAPAQADCGSAPCCKSRPEYHVGRTFGRHLQHIFPFGVEKRSACPSRTDIHHPQRQAQPVGLLAQRFDICLVERLGCRICRHVAKPAASCHR